MNHRITYARVTIEPLTPWRIGTVGESRSTLETVKDAGGIPQLPPTSLAGSFRTHLGSEASTYMGSTKGADELSASHLWFLGTRIVWEESAELKPQIRFTTPIDRNRSAARKGGSHGVEEVCTAREIRLYLRIDHTLSGKEINKERLLSLLASWPVTIGGGLSVGLGHAKVTAIRYRSLDFSIPDDVLARAMVSGHGPEALDELLVSGKDQEIQPVPVSELLTATMKLTDLNIPVPNNITTPAPKDHWFHGTSWKGLLRARVEFIGRSVGANVCGLSETGQVSREWAGCGKCAVCEVFGSGATGVGRLAFDATDLRQATDHNRQRNSINRLSSAVENFFPEWTTSAPNARLVIRQIRPLKQHHTWVIKALLLALRDLDDGFTGIGGRGATGLGAVSFLDLKLNSAIQELGITATRLSDAPKITVADLREQQNA